MTELLGVVLTALTAPTTGVLVEDAGATVTPAGAARKIGTMVDSTTWEVLMPEGRVAVLRLASVS